jgi:hypothetical protein
MTRGFLLAALVAAVVTTAAVVGLLGSGNADAARVRAAAAKLDASGSRFTVTARYEGAAPLPDWALGETMLLRGEMDYAAQRGTLRYGEDEVVYEAVFDGSTLYTREPALTELLDIQQKWIKSASQDWRSVNPDDPSMGNPATLLGKLQASSDDVRDLGADPIDGTETRHYAGTFDLAKIVPATEDGRLQLQDELDARAQFGDSTRMPYEAWVQDGVIRRLSLHYGTPDRTDAQLVTTVDFYDFGVPVTIDVPAPDQVITSDEVNSLLENFTVDEEASA